MTTVAVLSMFAGPAGVVFGAGAMILQSVLPLLDSQKDEIKGLDEILKDAKLDGLVDDHIAKVRSTIAWINLHKSTWDEVSVELQDFQKVSDERCFRSKNTMFLLYSPQAEFRLKCLFMKG